MQQRALLAVLVLHRGEAVSTDRLVDELWGERAPATAAKTVQVYVSHLRKALGAGVIVTQGRGYRLAVEPEQVDAVGSRRLAPRGGGRLPAAMRPARGSGCARRWGCGGASRWPISRTSRSRRLRSGGCRRRGWRRSRIGSRPIWRSGADGELIAEIESLIAANPLQERLRGQLMLALYRAGRQADALAVYRQTSELLREELGLEPGRSLQELERSILGARRVPGRVPRMRQRPAACCWGCARSRGWRSSIAPMRSTSAAASASSPTCSRGWWSRRWSGSSAPSGIGKSSLLRAGVLPALSAGVVAGQRAVAAGAAAAGRRTPTPSCARALAGDRLGQVLGQLAPGERLVIAVDQLEELFTLCEQRGRACGVPRAAGGGGGRSASGGRWWWCRCARISTAGSPPIRGSPRW